MSLFTTFTTEMDFKFHFRWLSSTRRDSETLKELSETTKSQRPLRNSSEMKMVSRYAVR
jgi:hypothetical protein